MFDLQNMNFLTEKRTIEEIEISTSFSNPYTKSFIHLTTQKKNRITVQSATRRSAYDAYLISHCTIDSKNHKRRRMSTANPIRRRCIELWRKVMQAAVLSFLINSAVR